MLNLYISLEIRNPPFLLTANSNMAEIVREFDFCATPGSALSLVTNVQQRFFSAVDMLTDSVQRTLHVYG